MERNQLNQFLSADREKILLDGLPGSGKSQEDRAKLDHSYNKRQKRVDEKELVHQAKQDMNQEKDCQVKAAAYKIQKEKTSLPKDHPYYQSDSSSSDDDEDDEFAGPSVDLFQNTAFRHG